MINNRKPLQISSPLRTPIYKRTKSRFAPTMLLSSRECLNIDKIFYMKKKFILTKGKGFNKGSISGAIFYKAMSKLKDGHYTCKI